MDKTLKLENILKKKILIEFIGAPTKATLILKMSNFMAIYLEKIEDNDLKISEEKQIKVIRI